MIYIVIRGKTAIIFLITLHSFSFLCFFKLAGLNEKEGREKGEIRRGRWQGGGGGKQQERGEEEEEEKY